MTPKLFVEPGHFYSPIPSDTDNAIGLEVARKEAPSSLPGIAINDAQMFDLWNRFQDIIGEMPFQDQAGASKYRYNYENKMYLRGDASVYFGMLRTFKPAKVIEIGSGYTSALALDVRDIYGYPETLTFIEPYPTRLKSLLRETDTDDVSLIENFVQKVPLETYDSLQEDDILFIDSSHVVKTGSDVCFEVFQILPRLKPGVIVHFHDCFWPFEYPERWLKKENRSWNELYLLRAFLQFNPEFEILFFNSYFFQRYRDNMIGTPGEQLLSRPGGALWLRRL